jgi:hypothetical protein
MRLAGENNAGVKTKLVWEEILWYTIYKIRTYKGYKSRKNKKYQRDDKAGQIV